MEHDIDRPIQIFAHSFPGEEIEKDATTVLKNLITIDREVTVLNGRCYTLRLAPYRTTENSIRGLVITIIDSLRTDRPRGPLLILRYSETKTACPAPPGKRFFPWSDAGFLRGVGWKICREMGEETLY